MKSASNQMNQQKTKNKKNKTKKQTSVLTNDLLAQLSNETQTRMSLNASCMNLNNKAGIKVHGTFNNICNIAIARLVHAIADFKLSVCVRFLFFFCHFFIVEKFWFDDMILFCFF